MKLNITLVKKSVIFFELEGLTEAVLKKALLVDPNCNKVRNDDGDVLFAIMAGTNPSISNAGIVFNDKKDIVVVSEKPTTVGKVKEDYGVAQYYAKKALEQIEAASALVGNDEFEVAELNTASDDVEEA